MKANILFTSTAGFAKLQTEGVKRFLKRLPKWKAIRVFVYLLAGLLLVEALARFGKTEWNRYSPDDYLVRMKSCQEAKPEVLILGGSPVAEAFIPMEMTKANPALASTFALGLSGGTTTDFFFALKHGVTKPPKMLIYGITLTDLNDNRNEPHGISTYYTIKDVMDCVATRPENAKWFTSKYSKGTFSRWSSLYHHRNGIRLAATDAINAIVPGFSPEGDREVQQNNNEIWEVLNQNGYSPQMGFRHRDYGYCKSVGEPGSPFGFLNNYKTGSHVKYLHRIREWARDNGVTLVLVDLPVTEDLEAEYARELAEYRQLLIDLEREHQVRIIRASSKAVGLTDGDFADIIHLNTKGAAKVTRYVAEALK